jgi:predicted amidohydrolase YtcJ
MVRTGTWLMPNLTAFKIIGLQVQDLAPVLARPEMRFLPSAYRTGWGPETNPYTNRFGKEQGPGIMARFEVLQQLVQGFQSGGVRMLVGTDALNTGVVPGFSVHDELAELVAAGLTPYQALRAGTANAAEFVGVQDTRGTVASGREADLVLLDANPLTDIAYTRRIDGVMLRGRWFSRAQIAVMLEKLAAM